MGETAADAGPAPVNPRRSRSRTTDRSRPPRGAPMPTTPIMPGVTEPTYDLATPLDLDYAGAFADATEEDRAHQQRVRQFVQDEVLPVIDDYWERAEVPFDLVKRMGELDLLRDGVDVEGRPRVSLLGAGLAAMEMSRGDGSVATICGVQGGLALRSIQMLGSDEQRARYAEPMARGEV